MDHRVFLKLKIKSLAAEARLDKMEEWRHPLRDLIHAHRVNVIRPEARVALLAYGFLRGRTREMVEARPKRPFSWTRLQRLVAEYGLQQTAAVSDLAHAQAKKEEQAALKRWTGLPAEA